MHTRRGIFIAAALGLLLCEAGRAKADIPPPPAWAKGYQQVWAQDFSKMKELKDLGVSASRIGDGTWIAHKPGGGDWFTFQDPTGPFHPFGVGNGYLTIRVQKDGHDPHNWFSGFSGGLLSSMDETGKGFAQQYGYFECSMWCPGGPNTWPAFWLLDSPSLLDKKLAAAEIDITESYGNFGAGPGKPGDPNQNCVTWHRWTKPPTGNGSFHKGDGMTTGFHTYGCDIEPTGITWYFDRKKVWWAPIYPEAQRPMFVMVNLALGGGNHNNAKGDGYDWNLTPNPTDLKVKYVAVWASPASPNYTGPPVAPANLKATRGNKVVALSWDPALGAVSYNVLRDGKVVATGVTATDYVDRNLSNGTSYRYTVATVNARGTSKASNTASATPRLGPPIDPANLKATPGDGQIALSWTPSPDAVSYNIYRGNEAGTEDTKPIATGITEPSYTDRGLTAGMPYFYTVAAVSPGGKSRQTNEANGIPALNGETVAIAYAEKAPAMDGIPDACWSKAAAYPIARLGLGTPTSTNGVFQALWDPERLYFLFTVNDSALVTGKPDYNGDAVEIYLDAKNTKQTKYDDTDFRYTLGYGHSTISEATRSAVAGVTFGRKAYAGGYRTEIAIPWKLLKVTPFAGMSLGLDTAIDDGTTAAHGRSSALFWHDNSATDYQNPSLFGNATLQPQAPPPPPKDGTYKIINVKSGKALTVPGASMENVKLDQSTYEGGVGQQWTLTHLGGGAYAIANVKSKSVVDCAPSFEEGHQVVQWPIHGVPSATQRFTLTAIGGHYLLTNVYSGKALDIAGGSTEEHAFLAQSAVTATGTQLWDLVEVNR